MITHIGFQIHGGDWYSDGRLRCSVLFLPLEKIFPAWYLKLVILFTPLGFICDEAGWIVTEVGRQPWIIYGILKTKDAVTPVPGMQYHFYLFLNRVFVLGLYHRVAFAKT